MNFEDIKVGESYNVYGCIGYKNEDEISITFECKPGVYCSIPFAKSHASMYFSPAPAPPQHDPTRPFKEGDIVKTVERWGRKVPDAVDIYGYEVPGGPENKEWVVQEAETSGMVEVLCKIGGEFYRHKLPFFHLELITPVEELEPYYIVENDIEFQVRMRYEDKDCLISVFRFKNIVEGYKQYYDMLPTMKQAREAAEAECKRLNEEYRKEQK